MEIAPWQEPVRGGYPDPRSFGLTGREIGRLVAAGRRGVRPPISRLMGLLWTEADDDHTVFTLPGADWFLSSQEHVSAGPLMVLADAAFGTSLMIDLPSATPFTTWELSMSFLKPCPAGGTIRAMGYPLHDGRPLAITQVWIEDGQGERVAHGTSANMVLPRLEGFEHPGELPDIPEPVEATPDPWERPVMGETIPWDLWRTMPGLEILGRQIKGDLPQPPIHYLTGMTLREAGEGRVTFTMPATEWLASPNRTVQGGAIAMLAHAALTTAVTSTLEAGAAYRPIDVKVNFLRPGIADGRDLTAHGSVIHRGRTLAVGLADVVNADGKMVATATGSVIILPERPEG